MTECQKLLTRDEFREQVFARDKNKCVACEEPAQDAHHIIERRLFPDGGYYIDNGTSVCSLHHLEAEATTLSCSSLREMCGIKRVVLPPHLYEDGSFDKWGNIILPNGQRLKGELFHDESVQKIMAPVLHLFTDKVKHPRTFHLPWSPGLTKDDRQMPNTQALEMGEVVVTAKMDGEQTSMYRTGFHARSTDYSAHPSRDWLWGIHRRIGYEIPEGWRVCGENLYAVHSIKYKNLRTHFMVHSIWDDHNTCLSWDETEEWTKLLDLITVPVLWVGNWDEVKVKDCLTTDLDGDECEGYVVRVTRRFEHREYPTAVGKFVRKGHVHAHGHWSRRVEVNGLRQFESDQ